MSDSGLTDHLPNRPGDFDRRPLPVAVFLVVAAIVPVVVYWVVRPVLRDGLGLDLAQNWPRIAGTVVGGTLVLLLGVGMLRWEGVSLERIGGSRRHALWGIGWFLGIVAALNALLFVVALTVADSYEITVGGLAPLDWVGFAVVNWVFVGLAEELIARGYLQNKLIALLGGGTRIRRRVAGVVLAALLFAAWHLPQRLVVAEVPLDRLPVNLLQLALVAVGVGLVYELTRNLVLVALVHGAWNFPPIFLSVYGTRTWQGVVLLLAIVVPFVVGIVLYWRLAVGQAGPRVPS